MSTVIKVENLGKSYLIGHKSRESYTALRDLITNKARQITRNTLRVLKGGQLVSGDELEEFWALKDVSFEVQQGDRLGIIGRNGAGKSTLLKVLSRITEPTTGRFSLKGRVASLLEVGTGFHPELSGRENIFLNGAILGMSRTEVRKKFDEIVDFSGVEKFLDTPVKRYSSGMYVRLAFAVAAHLEPEILIIDEVLAVGDAEFQKKAIGKMQNVSLNEGRTVLFVSHNMAAISTLTTKSICLVDGFLIKRGKSNEVINFYLNESNSFIGEYRATPSSQKPNFTKINLRTSEGQNVHKNGEDLEIYFEVNMPFYLEGMGISFQIFSEREIPIIYGYIFDTKTPILRKIGINKYKCTLPKCRLYQGRYYIKAHLAESRGKIKFEEIDRICLFEVVMLGETIEWGWQPNVCSYTEDCNWEEFN